MGLIYCTQNKVNKPYYVEELHLSLYSAEELCYIIYEYFEIIQNALCKAELFQFIKEELEYPELAQKLTRLQKEEHKQGDLLWEILSSIPYYSPAELKIWKEKLDRGKPLHPAQWLVERAKYYTKRKKYHRALHAYQEFLSLYENQVHDPHLVAEVYAKMGYLSMGLFEFTRAASYYERSQEIERSDTTLKNLYMVSLFDEGIRFSDAIKNQIPLEKADEWKKEWENLRMDIAIGEEVMNLRLLFQEKEEKTQEIEDIIVQWKKEYDDML